MDERQNMTFNLGTLILQYVCSFLCSPVGLKVSLPLRCCVAHLPFVDKQERTWC